MPVHELPRVVRGTSSVARWRRISLQWVYAFSIILSIAIADRVMLLILGGYTPGSIGPAHLLLGELGARAPHSFWAAPMTASLILLVAVLVAVELFRLRQHYAGRRARRTLLEQAPTLSQSERAAEPLPSRPSPRAAVVSRAGCVTRRELVRFADATSLPLRSPGERVGNQPALFDRIN
jgi:hypothetical protein